MFQDLGGRTKNTKLSPARILFPNIKGKPQMVFEANILTTSNYQDNRKWFAWIKPSILDGRYWPDPSIPYDWYSVRWGGKLSPPATGRYEIGIEGNDGYRMYINGKMVIDDWQKRGYGKHLVDYDFMAGQQYDIKIEYFESTGNARFKLIWNYGVDDTWERNIQQAVKIARASNLAVVVAGIEEGEFRDRASLDLPGHQEELIRHVAATGKPVVVIIVGGSAVTMSDWLDKVSGVLDVWYPGEVGGAAVAEVLFGDYNPAGRLPITFPVSEGQLPLYYNHKPTGRGDDYMGSSQGKRFSLLDMD